MYTNKKTPIDINNISIGVNMNLINVNVFTWHNRQPVIL